MSGFSLFPEEASTQAPATDLLFLILMLVSAAIIALVLTLVITFSLRYRRGTHADRGPLREVISREWEIGWTVATCFLALFLFWWSGSANVSTLVPPKDAIEIHVVAKQWMWKTQHSNGAREINALHVPVNEPVKLIMTSQDVIHSFFVPDFRIKRDVLPGRYTQTWFNATKKGTYHLFCAQYCGTQHSRMIGEIVVMPKDEFAKWLHEQPLSADISKEGAALYASLGCASCHEGKSRVHAPQLAGMYGKPIRLRDGRLVTADDDYIRDMILEPDKHVVEGYEPLMPSFEGLVGDDEILRLTAYIRSLKDKGKTG